MTMPMKVSSKGLEFIKKEEGIRLREYKDPAGLPTIGVGHLLTKSELTSGKIWIKGTSVRYGKGITEQQALQLLDQDLDYAENAVNLYTKSILYQFQFDALVSFVFNAGVGAFRGSTLLKKINSNQFQEVPNQLRRWIYSRGEICEVLIDRREREIKLWNDDL